MAAVLDAFASKLAGILVGMAKEEVEMLLGVPGEITKLETTLGDLSSILADADRRRIRDSAAERWVRELKDVMYDADDILDLCQIMEGGDDPSLPRAAPKSASGCWNIPMLFCFPNPVVAHNIGRKIQELNQRLEDIAKRSSRFGFVTQAISSSSYSADKADSSWSDCNWKTGSAFIRSDIVGEKIEEDTRKLVDLLVNKVGVRATSDNGSVAVVAISGVGGIGKTTLARMVFNDSVVEENFKKIWLSVNQEVNEIAVMRSIISQLGGNYDRSEGDKAQLEHALKESVRQKRFLLVMDDVWSEEVWNELLRVPLNDGASGSRVLVTTRNDGVARGMRVQHLHRVDKLAPEDAWTLLKKQIVLTESDESEVDGLKEIGMKIVERCDGLPLAIKVVGGLLLKKSRTRGAWIDVSKHDAWSIPGTSDDLNKAVYVSYEELPCHLKQCLLFSSLVPKDDIIRRGVIIRMWMAEGYVDKQASSKLPEDLGQEYYQELISRNLLQPNDGAYDQSSCTMHDVVRSFAQYIMKDEGLLVSDGQNLNSTLGTLKLRHLSISGEVAESGAAALQKQVSLRTLMLFGSTMVELQDFWNNLSCLRVIELYSVNLAELPDSICRLKHLRYLGLARTSISSIPQDIGDVKFLKVIDLTDCANISSLPNSILKLRNLRYIDFRGTKITSIPRDFGKIEDLVQIAGFPTDSDDSTGGWCSLEELGSLSKLKYLDIEGLEKASSGSVAARAKLSSKQHLIDLDLTFTSRLGGNGEVEDSISKEEQERIEDVLGNLCPPTCIELFTISGYFGHRIPRWMRTMSAFGSLRRLVLEDYACCQQLPNGLGQLPFLDYLWIHRAPSIECIGHDLLLPSSDGDGDGVDKTPATAGTEIVYRRQRHHLSRGAGVAFPKMITLGFGGMLSWREWDWEEQVPGMAALDSLTIGGCKLRYLPPGLAYQARGLSYLELRNVLHLVTVECFPSLVTLKIFDNPELERVTKNPSLQQIIIIRCPGVKVLEDLPSLRSIHWKDLDAEALPEYLRETKLNKLRVDCSPRLLKLISLQDSTSEWGKIQHVQELTAIGWKSEEDMVDRHIYYTKEPYSFEADMGENSDSTDEEVE